MMWMTVIVDELVTNIAQRDVGTYQCPQLRLNYDDDLGTEDRT